MNANTTILPAAFAITVPVAPDSQDNWPRGLFAPLGVATDLAETAKSTGLSKELGLTLEAYLRPIVTQLAVRVKLIHVRKFLESPRQVRALLSPSIRSRISLVDPRKSVWNCAKHYLDPILMDFQDADPNMAFDIDEVAWQLYLLCLGAKHRAEVPVSASAALDGARKLGAHESPSVSPESRARLALVAGLFESLSSHVEVPALRLRAEAPATAIRDRIDEILEDAYLLEASHLRRFIGLRPNVASLRRDLRLVLRTVHKHSGWAKGILRFGSSLLGVPSSSAEITDKLAEHIALPGSLGRPVMVNEEWNSPGSGHVIVTSSEGIRAPLAYGLSVKYESVDIDGGLRRVSIRVR